MMIKVVGMIITLGVVVVVGKGIVVIVVVAMVKVVVVIVRRARLTSMNELGINRVWQW